MFVQTISLQNGALYEYLSYGDIREKVYQIAKEIDRYYYNEEVVLIGILRGCFPFMIDLYHNLQTCFPKLDYMGISSYKNNAPSKEISIYMHPKISLENQNVLIIDTITSSGITINTAIDYIKTQNPASIQTCSLLNNSDVTNNFFKGWHIEKRHFLVGYGLDLDSDYRHLKGIYEYVPKEIA